MSKLFDKSWSKKTDTQRFETLVDWVHELVWGTPRRPEPKRARTKDGRYKADDPTTKDFNEAWVRGVGPKKRKTNDRKTKKRNRKTD